MITFRTLSTGDYQDTAFGIVVGSEGYEALPYNDLDSLITIGYGFNIQNVAVLREEVYAQLGFTAGDTTYKAQMDNRAISAPP